MTSSLRRWITALLLTLAAGAYAAVPQQFTYQGFLTSAGGAPISASLAMQFRLWDAASGGTNPWSESQTVAVNNGVFTVILGVNTPIAVTFDKPYFLEVQVGGDAPMTPRQPLTSVPYAAAGGLPGCSPGDVILCYNGAPGTLNVGTCKAGMRACNPATLTYGPCTGEVIPTAEVADGLDNDCNGVVDNGAYANGIVCGSNGQCASGFCIDGVCCNSSCAGTCQACTIGKKGGGSDGTCGNIVSGTDPDGECSGGRLCNGAGACETLLANGGLCDFSSECLSGLCELSSASGGTSRCSAVSCGACSFVNAAGTACTGFIAAGLDPKNACPGASVCDGAGSCVP